MVLAPTLRIPTPETTRILFLIPALTTIRTQTQASSETPATPSQLEAEFSIAVAVLATDSGTHDFRLKPALQLASIVAALATSLAIADCHTTSPALAFKTQVLRNVLVVVE